MDEQEFREKNPKIAVAMDTLGMTYKAYLAYLESLKPPTVIITNVTGASVTASYGGTQWMNLM